MFFSIAATPTCTNLSNKAKCTLIQEWHDHFSETTFLEGPTHDASRF